MSEIVKGSRVLITESLYSWEVGRSAIIKRLYPQTGMAVIKIEEHGYTIEHPISKLEKLPETLATKKPPGKRLNPAW